MWLQAQRAWWRWAQGGRRQHILQGLLEERTEAETRQATCPRLFSWSVEQLGPWTWCCVIWHWTRGTAHTVLSLSIPGSVAWFSCIHSLLLRDKALPILQPSWAVSILDGPVLASVVLSGLSWQYHALPYMCCVNYKPSYSVRASLLSSRPELPISYGSLNMQCSKLISISQKTPFLPDGSQWLKTSASLQSPSFSSTPKSSQLPSQRGIHTSSPFPLLLLLLGKCRLSTSLLEDLQ